jgi:cytochrome c-type biogenesis protein CcmH/NrfG
MADRVQVLDRAVLKHDPNNVEAITYLGVILGIANHADGALEAFDKALRVNPKYPDALFHKGRILYEAKQDYPKAIKTLETYLTVAPTPEARTQAQLLLQEAKARMLPGAKPAPPK